MSPDEAQVTATIANAVRQRGPIQICIANAGIAEGRALHKTEMDFWRRMMATNLDGAFLTIRESLRSMRDTDWGRVIAISSIAGLKGLKGAPAYTASKHGMIGLIRALSEDYLGAPFTFNAVCPGYVDTEIVTPQRHLDPGARGDQCRRGPRHHGRGKQAQTPHRPKRSGAIRALALRAGIRERQRTGH